MSQLELGGRRILIVEDEALVAMSLEEMLIDAGAIVLGPVSRLETAVEAAGREPIDIALLDVSLAGVRVFPVADRLTERRIPFIFLTGYGPEGLPTPYSDSPVLGKPCTGDRLLAAVVNTLAQHHALSGSRA